MAEVRAAVVNIMGDETGGVDDKEVMELKVKIEGFIEGKGGSAPADLPQDYLPCSPRTASIATLSIDEAARGKSSRDSPTVSSSAANAHTWVSPNKSDEVPSSKESSPNKSEQTSPQEIEKLSEESNAETSPTSIEACLDATYDADFEPAPLEGKPDFDLSIMGQSLEVQNSDALSVVDGEAILAASSKDFVRIIHGDKEVMLVMPSEVSCELGSTLELSETLASSLGINDEIIGLKTTAMLLDDDEVSKHHGDVVIPFSSLVSGQLRRLLKNAKGMEGIPSFNLVTTNFDLYHENQLTTSESDREPFHEEESQPISAREGALYTEAFVELMEKSEEFDPFEKNSLLRFGIDNAKQGNVLYRASFRVAVYTGDMKYFVQGLKAIAKILLRNTTSTGDDESYDGNLTDTKETSIEIFGLTDFVLAADELFESNDLSAQQYVTLLEAFFSGHSSVQSLFDLYHNPDFLVACDSDAGLRASLRSRDLLHLGQNLEPLLQPNSQDDEHLKWAIRTGIHNLATRMSIEMPQEFVTIIYHMFSSGDEMVLAACQQFLDTSNSEYVEAMLVREWDIYCRNKAYRGEGGNVSDAAGSAAEPSGTMVDSSSTKASDGHEDGEFPDVLLTAAACLVDQQDLSEDSAAALLASYAKGNQLLRDVYDHFIEFGGVDDFLDMLKIVASMSADQFGASGVAPGDDTIDQGTHNVFRNVLKDMHALGQVEIAALRLAAVRKDPKLTKALASFRDGSMDSDDDFKRALLDVVDDIVQETDSDLAQC